VPYCSESEFVLRFGQEELDALIASGTGRTYTAAAADADGLIDSYIGARYALPLASTPAIVLAIASDLTRWELYEEKPTEEVEARRKFALEQLEQIRDGDLLLPGVAVATGMTISIASRAMIFTEDLGDCYMGRL
jgi:phage gp36-like protein